MIEQSRGQAVVGITIHSGSNRYELENRAHALPRACAATAGTLSLCLRGSMASVGCFTTWNRVEYIVALGNNPLTMGAES